MPRRQSMTFEVFHSLAPNRQGFFLLNLPKKNQEKILSALTPQEIAGIISFLDPSQATDIVQKISDEKKQDQIINQLNEDLQKKVSFLFGFSPNSAAGIMDVNYIEVSSEDSFRSVKMRVGKYQKHTGKVPTILVLEDSVLKGELPHKTFLVPHSKRPKKITRYIHQLPTIHHAKKPDRVLEILKQSPHKRVVVLDDENRILGVIYSDDIIRLLQKQNSTGLYNFAGVHKEEDIFDPIATKVHFRYKWLIINLGTAYLAAWVVSLFADTLSKFVLLAAYMPIVAGMGGNASTQTLAVMVRSIALGEIELKNCYKAVLNEVGAGLINGFISGSIVAIIALFWNENPLLGFITGAAMVINLIVAGFFGSVIPLIMKRMGKDPATSATIFITTATDVFGFLTFLGLATLFLR